MIGLRAGAAVGALVVFLEPAVELRQVAREPNRIAVLDRRLEVDGARRGARRPDAHRARAPAARGLERHARGVGARPQDRLLHVLRDARARRRLPALANDTAQGKATLIRKALEQVRGRYEGRDLAGIVLISDGAATGGFDEDSGDGAVRDFLRSLDTRVHTVWAARTGLQRRRGREGRWPTSSRSCAPSCGSTR